MSDNNNLKSPKSNAESSPIRNLFRKNETVAQESSDNTDSNKPKTINKNDNIQQDKLSQPKKDEKTKDNSKTVSENTDEKTKEKKSDKKEEDSENTEEKNTVGKTSKSNDLSDGVNKNISENQKSEEQETKKTSVFGKFKTKIKDIVMSMKQPTEEYEDDNEIKDIFSTSGNFVREKNANPLDVDEEFKENVIYSAPKKEKSAEKAETTIKSVSENDNKSEKSKPKNKNSESTDDKEAFEIIENLQLKQSDKKEINDIVSKAEDKKQSGSEKSVKSDDKEKTKSELTEKKNDKAEVKTEETKSDEIGKTEKSESEPAEKKDSKPETEKAKSEENKKSEKISEAVKNNPLPPVPPKPKKWSDIDIPVGKESSIKSEPVGKKENKPETEKVKSEENKKSEKVSEAVKNNPLPPVPPKPKKWSDIDIPVGKESNIKSEKSKSAENKTDKSETETKSKDVLSESKTENTVNLSAVISKDKKLPDIDNSVSQSVFMKSVNPNKLKYDKSDQKTKKTDIADKIRNSSEKKTDTDNKKPEKTKSEARPDDDIKVIPWSPADKNNISEKTESNKNADNNSDKNTILTYHYNKSAVPFIVMAGKFTKTVRNEYEEIRKYNEKSSEKELSDKKTENKKSDTAIKSDNQPLQQKTAIISELKTEKNISSTSEPNPNKIKKNKNISKPVLVEKKNEPKEETEKLNNNIKNIENIKQEKAVSKNNKKHQKQKNRKFERKSIFSGEEEYDPDDENQEIIEEKPPLDDYNEEKDAEEIRMEINENFRHVFIRTVILTVTSVLSVIVSIIAQCFPSLFTDTMKTGWLVYAIINFILFAVSVVVSRVPIVNGLMPLKHFKGNSDTGIAVASFAAMIQSIVAMFQPDIFVNGTMYIYAPLVTIALLLNSIGKMLIILRVSDNFRFLTKPNVKFAGKIYTDIKNAEKMTTGLPAGKPIIAYMKKSKFMSNFLKLSYAPDPSEDAAAKIAPFAALASLICGIAYGVLTLDFAGAVSSFALTACITTPICCLLAVNIPMKRLCRTSVRSGAMVTGYETVKQFCDTNAVMIDVSQLYPKGTITLNGMKTFKESKINDAIMAGAAIMFAVNGTMSYIFENIIQGKKDILPEVDSVIYEDGMGLLGWVGGQRVLIGNRCLLEAHNIKPPSKDIEDKYHSVGNEIMYISMSGELVAMFILSYNPSKEIMHELRNLEDNGVSFVVRTVDPNITQEHIAEKFSLFFRCIKILPTGLGNICHEVTSSVDDTSRAYLATRGKLSSFAKAISGCIKIKSNVTLSVIIQYMAIIIGVLLVTLISFISGFRMLGCLEMLLYIGFWILAAIIIPSLKK